MTHSSAGGFGFFEGGEVDVEVVVEEAAAGYSGARWWWGDGASRIDVIRSVTVNEVRYSRALD